MLIGLHYRAPGQSLPRLAASEFGLWLQHKGGAMFESAPALLQITEPSRGWTRRSCRS